MSTSSSASSRIRHPRQGSSRSLRAAVLASPALIALASFSGAAHAATLLYWDTNGATPDTGATPNGVWDNAASNWNDQSDGGGAGVIGPWVTDNTAVFSAGSSAVGPYTVSISGTQQAADVNVKDGAVVIKDGQLNLSNGVFDVSNTGSATVSSIIGGGVGLNKTGTGSLTLADGSTYTGTTKITGGTLVASSGGLGDSTNGIEFDQNAQWTVTGPAGTITRPITLTGDGTINNATDQTFTGVISGGGFLTKSGNGTMRLGITVGQANTFTTGIKVTGGVLQFPGEGSAVIGDPNPLGAYPATTVLDYITLSNGATLRNTIPSGTSFVLQNRGITIGPGGGTLDMSNAPALTYAGKISGADKFTIKAGTGTLYMTGSSNPFTAGFKIQSGTYQYSSFEASGDAAGVQRGSGVVPASVTPDYIVLDGGTMFYPVISNGSTYLHPSKGITVTANGGGIMINDSVGPWDNTAVTSSLQSTNYQGLISGSGASSTLIKRGKGEFRAQRANAGYTFSKLVVESGFYKAQTVGPAGLTDTGFGAVPGTFDPAAIETTSAGTDRASGGAAIGVGGAMISPPTRGMTIGVNGVTMITGAGWTFQGAITGPGGINLNENGWNPNQPSPLISSQKLQLSGNNTYQGNTTINTATLEAVGGSAIPDNSAVTIRAASSNTSPVQTQAVLLITNAETIGSLAGGGGTYGKVTATAMLTTGNNGKDTTFSGQISGAGGVTKIGTGTWTIQGFDWSTTGPVNINGGTIKFGDLLAGFNNASPVTIAGAATLDMGTAVDTIGSIAGAGPIINGGNLILAGNNGSPVTWTGNYSGTGTLTKNGAGTQNLGGNSTYASATVSAGTLGIQSSNAVGKGNLDVQGTSLVKYASTGSGVDNAGAGTIAPRLQAVTVAAGAKIDIANNKLITTSAVGSWNGSQYTGVTGMVTAGRGSSNLWDGTTGITTSDTQAHGSNYTSIGVAKASDVRANTVSETALWGGQTITGTDTLVMYTYGGDATLDGKINVDDYIRIDNGIAGGLTGWSNGDFNYDGKVSIDDYITVIDANLGTQNGKFFSSGGVVAGGGGLSGVTAVPEPGSATLIGLAAAALVARRRRRKA